ncbi:MAG: 1,4-alpha-glucan branching protein GlgB, partial [Planctomycetales bacterium]|nr:1,4-alpha-glucan branching protein GlgB [Planctomycetales bacterium]NIM09741.1 1,4-alpha-glucan branching protein GlgB [Planctomycetales bacterium]NIN09213.1 1,4-alpha-glucan branching protein GlgB [Planctomycetales bacterium]NIN78313.1 1,4-alpha-glucan branching protein GlgB [Planctomycetales bacterium]NIO35496.1 1,4-alpha-glucan branching protein GlgB [Planctomycetales bacterium]
LLGEGTHWDAYNRLGAHLRTVRGEEGVNFAVWAPNARGVSVIGDFNGWDGRRHLMRKLIPSGIWELFIPELKQGAHYKYQIETNHETFEKSDPYGFAAELPPRTASIVAGLDEFLWRDNQWMEQRKNTDALQKPISIYEVHLGSWQKEADREHGWLSYRELAHRLVDYCREMGYTHLELLPISEHPFTGSWGYQTVGYYAVTSRYGSPEDFMYFVDYCHQHGIGVILDWVPAHFPRDGHGLRMFDGTALYEHADPRQGEHPDWGTLIFNYDRCEVRNFLIANAMFWLDKYHIDGLRVDAVASMLYLDYSREDGEWVPNEYGGNENLGAISLLKTFNEQAHLRFPGVLTVAEESTAWTGVSRPTYLGGLGFSLKWNMGWMNDTLDYMQKEPIHRKYHHDELTFSLIYAFTENFALPLSHDEVVHGKGSLLDQVPGDLWQKFANLRLLYTYMWTHPGKKLLFMGSDFGQWNEWNCDQSLQWDLLQWESHQGLKKLVADLNRLYRSQPALFEDDFTPSGFEWIDCHNYEDSTLSYIRRAHDRDDYLVVCCNFTPVVRKQHRLGVPDLVWYEEIFNSDSTYYGGSNVGNGPGVQAENIPGHDRPHSIQVSLPPLGVSVFKPIR